MLVKYHNDLLFVVIKKQCSYIGSIITMHKNRQYTEHASGVVNKYIVSSVHALKCKILFYFTHNNVIKKQWRRDTRCIVIHLHMVICIHICHKLLTNCIKI